MYTKQKTEHKRNRKMERRQQARRKRKNEPSEKEKLRPPKTTENYCQSYCRRRKKMVTRRQGLKCTTKRKAISWMNDLDEDEGAGGGSTC
jgi:hypothetical protein